MLEVRGIDAFHGRVQALHGLSFSVARGEVLCLAGRNGAGKTTALRAVMGLVAVRAGSVTLDGTALTGLAPHAIPRLGIGYVPQGRRLFAGLTVAETLEIGLMARGGGRRAALRDRALALFPRLAERLGQVATTLSGGEQQMLAMARALCLDPTVILLDEPTEGLQPSMVAAIRSASLELRAGGVAVVLVEQRTDAVLALADRVAFVAAGRNAGTVRVAELAADPGLMARHVGLG